MDFNTLARQQLALYRNEASRHMAGKPAKSTPWNHPVAGYDERCRVMPAGIPHGPCASVQLPGQFAIGDYLSCRDGLQGRPNATLKRCSFNGERYNRQLTWHFKVMQYRLLYTTRCNRFGCLYGRPAIHKLQVTQAVTIQNNAQPADLAVEYHIKRRGCGVCHFGASVFTLPSNRSRWISLFSTALRLASRVARIRLV